MDSNINTLNNQLLQLKMKNRATVFNNTQVMENLLKCFCHRKSSLNKDSASRKNSISMTDQGRYNNSGVETKRNNSSNNNNNNNNNNRRFDDLAEEEEEEMINLTITQTKANNDGS